MLPHAADVLPPLTDAYINSAATKYGISAKRRLQEWDKLIKQNQSKSEPEKLRLVNDFFNRIRYVSDLEHWGVEDFWATPAELLASNGGDCEDYAIAKYFTLVAMHVDPNKLKITYVKARVNNKMIAHMVLTYYTQPNAVPLVLDSLNKQIRPATQRPDLTPVYAFNGDGLWIVKSRTENRVGGSGKIRFWNEMKSRMGKEF
ncbi:transglutaminase-like cysteine peptidase [Oxalobacter formigenes]|uniref:transglutaminase-like cysteine peptidase n=1 Tax=Oxalobacter formigenes TaxID=847 RepID=UPI001E599BDF|nr:transglutaminase-like cysteine peptidase [Oxalobacter formigenes]